MMGVDVDQAASKIVNSHRQLNCLMYGIIKMLQLREQHETKRVVRPLQQKDRAYQELWAPCLALF